jgi:hypothetical protein
VNRIIAISVLVLVSSMCLGKDVYKYKDSSGNIAYSDQKPKDAKSIIEVKRVADYGEPEKPKVIIRQSINGVPVHPMGESIRVGHFVYRVDSAKRTTEISGKTMFKQKAEFSFLNIQVSMRNDSSEARHIPIFVLMDSEGNEYSQASGRYLVKGAFEAFDQINPTLIRKGIAVFDVPAGRTYCLKVAGGFGVNSFELIRVE